MRLVRRLYTFNLSSADPLYSTILRLLFGSVSVSEKAPAVLPSTPVSVIEKAFSSKIHPSLLSEVSYLRNLTRHNSINRTIIATFEGQIITILVIVCFILIILVRDYVVQQQPDIMRAGFAPVEVPAPHHRHPSQSLLPRTTLNFLTILWQLALKILTSGGSENYSMTTRHKILLTAMHPVRH